MSTHRVISQKLAEILEERIANRDELLQEFDRLEAISLDFLIGRWRGFEIKTGHPLDGSLERTGWYGKVFRDPETVFPLVYYHADKKGLFAGDPKLAIGSTTAEMTLDEVHATILKAETQEAKARIRMLEHRGTVSATMIYDEFPINDIFRKIDANRVLGLMDLKGVPIPYFFVLERDQDEYQIAF